MRRALAVLVLAAASVALVSGMAADAKPKRTPKPTPAPTLRTAASPMPIDRPVEVCLTVRAATENLTPGAFADAIARGAVIVTAVVPCPVPLPAQSMAQASPQPSIAPTPTPAPTRRPTPTPASETMHVWTQDPLLEWRWLDGREFSCEYDGAACWGMLVKAIAGCPRGLYGEVTVLDGSKIAIGYTNDTVGALGVGQQAKLVFESFESGARYAQPSELSCHS